MFKRKIKNISVSEMNEHLKFVKKNWYIIKEQEPEFPTFNTAYFVNRTVYFQLYYQLARKCHFYQCRKDDKPIDDVVTGVEAFRILSKYYKVPRMPPEICGSINEGGLSASPILWYNPKFERTWQKAICYDRNSAYSYAMLQPMPDTSVPWKEKEIIPGKEIGFIEYTDSNDGIPMLEAMFEGYSHYVFPLMESPFKRFVENWIKRKNNPKERSRAKSVLNFSIGYLQKVNPFLRAAIITYANNDIKKLIKKKTTLMCNTDSITSTVPLDLPIGKKIGEWKIEHEGLVAYVGCNYQWSDGHISYRGVPSNLIGKDFDITKSSTNLDSVADKMYNFDKDKFKLVEVK